MELESRCWAPMAWPASSHLNSDFAKDERRNLGRVWILWILWILWNVWTPSKSPGTDAPGSLLPSRDSGRARLGSTSPSSALRAHSLPAAPQRPSADAKRPGSRRRNQHFLNTPTHRQRQSLSPKTWLEAVLSPRTLLGPAFVRVWLTSNRPSKPSFRV
jgi:hypothetical protein